MHEAPVVQHVALLGRVGDMGWRVSVSSGRLSTIACTWAMRGSVVYVARSGGGDGIVISQ